MLEGIEVLCHSSIKFSKGAIIYFDRLCQVKCVIFLNFQIFYNRWLRKHGHRLFLLPKLQKLLNLMKQYNSIHKETKLQKSAYLTKEIKDSIIKKTKEEYFGKIRLFNRLFAKRK